MLGMTRNDADKIETSNTNEEICIIDLNKPEFKNISFKAESSRLNDILGCGVETEVCARIKIDGLWLPIYGTAIVVIADE